jgi:hypothetical protein
MISFVAVAVAVAVYVAVAVTVAVTAVTAVSAGPPYGSATVALAVLAVALDALLCLQSDERYAINTKL